jgi:RNA ligase
MKLHELIDKELLTEMYEQGYINLQVHPQEPLGILNYSDKCSWDGVWNDATMKCRGLIYNMQTYDIVARPFDKFFNYEQLPQGFALPFGSVTVTDKQDGSLGILYPLPKGGHAVATRGSFASDQARHATEIWDKKYAGNVLLYPGHTYLFEIIYPANRIVLNYGSTDDLVLLGGVGIQRGRTFGPEDASFLMNWPGPVTDTFSARTFEQALALPPRENAEGIVVMFDATGLRVKLKQADYVALHRIVTGMTDRSVWEALGAGKTVEEIKEPLPEEFWPWVDEVANGLYEKSEQILMSVWDQYREVIESLPENFTRKDFAFAVKDSPIRAYLFKYLDAQPIKDVVWKSIKPEAVRSLTTAQED